MTQGLEGIELVDASVEASLPFVEAARLLGRHRLSLAVLDKGRVVGLFTDEELLLGLSPRYLDELRHTAFLEAELPSWRERVAQVLQEPVRKHMRKPVTVQRDASAFHAAERFVHSDEAAIAVVADGERFVGMLSRTLLALELLRRLETPASGP